MNKNSDWYELSVWILNIFEMYGRFLCECYREAGLEFKMLKTTKVQSSKVISRSINFTTYHFNNGAYRLLRPDEPINETFK